MIIKESLIYFNVLTLQEYSFESMRQVSANQRARKECDLNSAPKEVYTIKESGDGMTTPVRGMSFLLSQPETFQLKKVHQLIFLNYFYGKHKARMTAADWSVKELKALFAEENKESTQEELVEFSLKEGVFSEHSLEEYCEVVIREYFDTYSINNVAVRVLNFMQKHRVKLRKGGREKLQKDAYTARFRVVDEIPETIT